MVNEKRSRAPAKFCAFCLECNDQEAAYRMFVCLLCYPGPEESPVCPDCMVHRHRRHDFRHFMSTPTSRADVFHASMHALFQESMAKIKELNELLYDSKMEILPLLKSDAKPFRTTIDISMNMFNESTKPYQFATIHVKKLSQNIYSIIRRNTKTLEGLSWVTLRKAGIKWQAKDEATEKPFNPDSIIDRCRLAMDEFTEALEIFREDIERLCLECGRLDKDQVKLWVSGEQNMFEFHKIIDNLIVELFTKSSARTSGSINRIESGRNTPTFNRLNT